MLMTDLGYITNLPASPPVSVVAAAGHGDMPRRVYGWYVPVPLCPPGRCRYCQQMRHLLAEMGDGRGEASGHR